MRERFDLASPDAYLWYVYWLAVVVMVALLIIGLVWRLRHRRARRAYFSSISGDPTTTLAPSTLEPGLSSLAGVVEAEAPGEPPIAVRATFTRDQYERSVRRAEDWSPSECRVEARPFTLVLNGSGARIQVLPRPDVQLAACASSARADEGNAASDVLFTAILKDGERALVTGELIETVLGSEEGGYRERRRSFKLQGPAGGRLCVESASARAERWAAPMPPPRKFGYGFVLFAILVGAISIAGFVHFQVDGEAVVAEVVQVDNERQRIMVTYFSSRGGSGRARFYCQDVSYDAVTDAVEVGDRVRITIPPVIPTKCYVGARTLFGDVMPLYFILAALVALFVDVWELLAKYPPPFTRSRWFDVKP